MHIHSSKYMALTRAKYSFLTAIRTSTAHPVEVARLKSLQYENVKPNFFPSQTLVRTDQAFLIYVHNGQYLIAQQGVIINYFNFLISETLCI